jgi:predicted Zn-dependent protease
VWLPMHHSANRMVQLYGLTLINQILFGSDSSATSGIAQVLEGILALKFSRDDEFQADSCAVAYTVATDYNPYGIKRFFEMLIDKYGSNSGVFEALSTHPDTQKRIDESVRIAKKTPNAPPDDGTTEMHITDFAAIKTKI